jgi:hypothetical protein
MAAPLRHSCRRCRLKLAEPVENPRSAFCCRGCYRQHYEKRCLVCERPVTARRRVCRIPKCQTEFRSLRRHSALGRFDPGHSPIGVKLASGTPILKGLRAGIRSPDHRYRTCIWQPSRRPGIALRRR